MISDEDIATIRRYAGARMKQVVADYMGGFGNTAQKLEDGETRNSATIQANADSLARAIAVVSLPPSPVCSSCLIS
jgi:hypothetical protein